MSTKKELELIVVLREANKVLKSRRPIKFDAMINKIDTILDKYSNDVYICSRKNLYMFGGELAFKKDKPYKIQNELTKATKDVVLIDEENQYHQLHDWYRWFRKTK